MGGLAGLNLVMLNSCAWTFVSENDDTPETSSLGPDLGLGWYRQGRVACGH